MLNNAIRLFVLNLICFSACTGTSNIVTEFSEVKITNIETGDPLVGAKIRVALRRTGQDWPVGDGTTPIAPTNADGVTTVPIIFNDHSRGAFDGSFRMEIITNEQVETVDVINELGMKASSSTNSVEIVKTNATAPPTPTVNVVLGSQPPQLELVGYVGFVEICSLRDGQMLFEVEFISNWVHVENLTVGQIPNGMRESTMTVSLCSVGNTLEPDSVGKFAAWVGTPSSSDDGIIRIDFCIDSVGAVSPCP